MTDTLTKTQRSYLMSTIKGSNTKAELYMKKMLKPLHFIYQPKGIYGKPDFANKKERIAIFIDGCFWHGCGRHFKMPESNTSFWEQKISRNKMRDRAVSSKLRGDGWRVIRVWEHDIALGKGDITKG